MTTRSRNEAKLDDTAEQDKVDQPTEADQKQSDHEAEEAREESLERVAATNAPSGEAGLPVDDQAVSQPPTPAPATHIDRNGVERITDGTDRDGWVPAPVDPHPSQVEAAEKRNAAIDKEREKTQEAVAKASRVSEDH